MRLCRMFNVNLDLNLNGLANTKVSQSERKENLFAFPSQRNVNEVNDHEFTRIISSVGAAGNRER